jgi:hypothetical protein
MALQNTSNTGIHGFDKELNKDIKSFQLPPNAWTHARNAINNSKTGDLGKLGNESSNMACAVDEHGVSLIPFEIIGVIHITEDKWLIYSTDEVDHEIGIFDESDCSYFQLVRDSLCLNFSRHNLIVGVCRATSTCTYRVYWDDGGRNISRTMEFSIDPLEVNWYTNPNSPIPWQQTCNTIDHCQICENTQFIDCDAMRLAPYIKVPCIQVTKGIAAGTLLNGSYFISVAYAIDGQKISDWYSSNVQSIFEHANSSGSIDVTMDNLDITFNEIIVAITSIINQQTVVRQAGIYSTHTINLSFDMIDNTWPAIPVANLPLMTPIIERSDAMYAVNNYLLRCGPSSREDFNYQPLANQIVAKWVSVEYPADYYVKGGHNTNYLRDEVYAFFIRWIYDTGDKSSSYHIPGRARTHYNGVWENTWGHGWNDSLTTDEYFFQAYNTGRPVNVGSLGTLPDGGEIIANGIMGYWESSESYPDDKPQIWNAFSNPLAPGFNATINPYNIHTNGVITDAEAHELDLCGKKIRHHLFPENCMPGRPGVTEYVSGDKIRVLGVDFVNIKMPVMNDGVTPIPGIVGYEILRGSRNGNKTVLAKGIINNMTEYAIENSTTRGLMPNWPYNDLNPNNFLTTAQTTQWDHWGRPWDVPTKNFFTFHSPETNFTNPYLSAHEVRVYGEYNGKVVGKFEKSEKHPKHKLLSDLCLILSSIVGIGAAFTSMHGKKTIDNTPPQKGVSGYGVATAWDMPAPTGLILYDASYIPYSNADLFNTLDNGTIGSNLFSMLGFGGSERGSLDGPYNVIQGMALATSYSLGQPVTPKTNLEESSWGRTPGAMRGATSVPMFVSYYTEGSDSMLNLIRAILKFRDYALRYHSHCYYDEFHCPVPGNRRREIQKQEYIGPQITNFNNGSQEYRINNLYRVRTVALQVGPQIDNPILHECTRIPASSVGSLWNNGKLKDPTQHSFDHTDTTIGTTGVSLNGTPQRASSHYVGLKQRIRNQYGQINGVKQLPASYCNFAAPVWDDKTNTFQPASSGVVFGGDTYINRYTEKNTFFFFYDWLYGQPDGAQFDYLKYRMLPWPRWWANHNLFETSDFTESFNLGNIQNIFNNQTLSGFTTPSDYSNLDGDPNPGHGVMFPVRLAKRFCWYYLFSSGVRDFFVESEINVAQRDWGEKEEEQFYNPYGGTTDTNSMFRTDLIKIGNYYKYDESLSYGKLFLNYVSWAAAQRLDYDPYIAETCFTYYPKRLVYSLPMQDEAVRDNWRIFLPNNYKDFLSIITCIKAINKSGAIIFFRDLSPIQFLGIDQLQTTSGTKLTIGDGGLFSQPMQNIANADKSYEYGSCQNRLSVINTPMGLFWMTQNQGKIYHYASGMNEISMMDIKWWFATYLPYVLTQQFPLFELVDNPVSGIGCQSIFDNENGLVYFCKKDYRLKDNLVDIITYEHTITVNGREVIIPGSGSTFWINNITPFELGDEVSINYFDDASWTVSYDPKIKSWISWHDWHPNLCMPGKNTFMTILHNGIWIHNELCNSYCKYYGVDYPWEVEYMLATQQSVTSLRSLEYMLEVYKYDDNCYDRFHVLDFNFDEVVIYNTEQVSGLLKLFITPKNQPWQMLNYPIINANNISVLFSKVEQKYRINQFWDITADRGEYNSMAERVIWNTAPNGYVRTLNPNNLNYNKESFQRKKFRHYLNYVLLRRNVSGNRKMLLVLANNKNLLSPR